MRQTIVGVAAVTLLAALGGPVLGAVQVGNVFQLGYPNWAIHGTEGPFYMTAHGGSPAASDSFATFCVETTRYFYPGHDYRVTGIDQATATTNRNLSGYTAWIYTMFRQADGWRLPSHFDTMTTEKYNILQYAVWAGMTRGTPSHAAVGAAGADDVKAEQTFGQVNGYLHAGWTNDDLHGFGIGLADFESSTWGRGAGVTDPYAYLGNVVVLNLVNPGDFGDAQDQIALGNGQGAPPVPEPMSLVVWSLIGLCACTAVYWQRRRST